MNLERLLYRLRQFLTALHQAPLTSADLDQARQVLTSRQMALFTKLQPSEQAHSLEVLRRLVEQEETHQDLLVAALLHDIGKIRFPLQAWERGLVVLTKTLFPNQTRQWGHGAPRGWRRPFVVAEQHPAWGAQIASQVGASELTVELIHRHQEPFHFDTKQGGGPSPFAPAAPSLKPVERLLLQLQAVDDQN